MTVYIYIACPTFNVPHMQKLDRTCRLPFMSAMMCYISEQVRLAGGKRLEVNTYEMARQSREAETKDSENE